MPGYSNGTFDPVAVATGTRRLTDFDDMTVSLHAKGVTTRDTAEHLTAACEASVSHETIPNITDASRSRNGLTGPWMSRIGSPPSMQPRLRSPHHHPRRNQGRETAPSRAGPATSPVERRKWATKRKHHNHYQVRGDASRNYTKSAPPTHPLQHKGTPVCGKGQGTEGQVSRKGSSWRARWLSSIGVSAF